jgi:hypothetical protein
VLTGGIYTPQAVKIWCVASNEPVMLEILPDADAIERMRLLYPNLETRLAALAGFADEQLALDPEFDFTIDGQELEALLPQFALMFEPESPLQ